MCFTDDIQIPLLAAEMKSGVLQRWLVSDGDRVEMGDVLYELATADQVFEIENLQSGVVRVTADTDAEYAVGHVVGLVEFTEEDRQEFYHLGISLNYQQRLALSARCGDMNGQKWMQNEFQRFIKNELGESGSQGILTPSPHTTGRTDLPSAKLR